MVPFVCRRVVGLFVLPFFPTGEGSGWRIADDGIKTSTEFLQNSFVPYSAYIIGQHGSCDCHRKPILISSIELSNENTPNTDCESHHEGKNANRTTSPKLCLTRSLVLIIELIGPPTPKSRVGGHAHERAAEGRQAG